MNLQPDFLGLGVHKGGSSWIYLALYEHPAICLPGRDLHFFSVEREWLKGRSWYEALFRDCRPGLIRGEYSNTYFPSPAAAARIRAWYPGVKLFVCLRNPVDRVFAHYLQDLKVGHLAAGTSFEEALDAHPEYLAWSRYRPALEAYLDAFRREQLLVVLFDDLARDPAALIRTLYRFLGVADDFSPSLLDRRVNASRLPRWPLVDRGIRRAAHGLRQSKAGRWAWWQTKRTGIPDRIQQWNTASTPLPVLSEAMRGHLRTLLAPDIHYVKTFLGREDLDW